jgi:hypothetical protein
MHRPGQVISSGAAMNGTDVDLYPEPQQASWSGWADLWRLVLHGRDRPLDDVGKPG